MADISESVKDWSVTAASNSPSGTTVIGAGLDDNLRAIQAAVRAALAHKGADIASNTTTDLGAVAGLFHDITGTNPITGFGTVSAGIWKVIKFEGILTLTHNATSLIIPGGANITTADGDMAMVTSEGSGNWRVNWYTRANGETIKLGANGADVSSDTTINLDTATGACVDVTGTTTIEGITLAAGRTRIVRFTGALTLTHGASLVLPGSANITTAAGDIAIFRGYASGVVRCVSFSRLNGIAIGSVSTGTVQATTSGTAFNFTFPAGVKRITISFAGVSLSGSDNYLVQIGGSGGIESTGYVSSSMTASAAPAVAVTNSTAGFIMTSANAALATTGHMTLTLHNAATFTWVSSHSCKSATTVAGPTGGGDKSLASELTQLTVTRTGSDTFDAGSVNVSYER